MVVPMFCAYMCISERNVFIRLKSTILLDSMAHCYQNRQLMGVWRSVKHVNEKLHFYPTPKKLQKLINSTALMTVSKANFVPSGSEFVVC